MKYTIIHEGKVFRTDWYDYNNHYIDGMTIINNATDTYTHNGIDWFDIQNDNL